MCACKRTFPQRFVCATKADTLKGHGSRMTSRLIAMSGVCSAQPTAMPVRLPYDTEALTHVTPPSGAAGSRPVFPTHDPPPGPNWQPADPSNIHRSASTALVADRHMAAKSIATKVGVNIGDLQVGASEYLRTNTTNR